MWVCGTEKKKKRVCKKWECERVRAQLRAREERKGEKELCKTWECEREQKRGTAQENESRRFKIKKNYQELFHSLSPISTKSPNHRQESCWHFPQYFQQTGIFFPSKNCTRVLDALIITELKFRRVCWQLGKS